MLARSRSGGLLAVLVVFGAAVGGAASCSRDERALSEIAAPITVPSGFSDHVVTTAIVEPIALDFLPDHTMLVVSRRGKVHVVGNAPGAPTVSLALDLSS